jgi:hypothetical protein
MISYKQPIGLNVEVNTEGNVTAHSLTRSPFTENPSNELKREVEIPVVASVSGRGYDNEMYGTVRVGIDEDGAQSRPGAAVVVRIGLNFGKGEVTSQLEEHNHSKQTLHYLGSVEPEKRFPAQFREGGRGDSTQPVTVRIDSPDAGEVKSQADNIRTRLQERQKRIAARIDVSVKTVENKGGTVKADGTVTFEDGRGVAVQWLNKPGKRFSLHVLEDEVTVTENFRVEEFDAAMKCASQNPPIPTAYRRGKQGAAATN